MKCLGQGTPPLRGPINKRHIDLVQLLGDDARAGRTQWRYSMDEIELVRCEALTELAPHGALKGIIRQR